MKAADKLKINLKTIFSSDDFKVLSLLYQPLIGSTAYTLYQTFYHLGHNNEYSHQEIIDVLNIKTNDFTKAREKLEAIGLLDSFKKDNNYVYVIKTPLSAKQFLNDTILGSYLESTIGKNELDKVVKLFKIETINMKDYDNITKKFDDVFESKEVDILQEITDLRGRVNNSQPTISNNFDYEEFINLVSNRAKKSQLLQPKIKELLNRLCFIYQFSLNDMAVIYNDSLDDFGYVDCNTLKLKSRLYFQNNNIGSFPSISEVENDNNEVIENTSPIVILRQFSKREVSSYELDRINELIERNNITIGYLNIVITYLLKRKEGILPNSAYIEKVIHTWQEKGIKTTEMAIDFVTKLENESTVKKETTKKTKKENDWFNNFLDELDRGEW